MTSCPSSVENAIEGARFELEHALTETRQECVFAWLERALADSLQDVEGILQRLAQSRRTESP